MLTKAGTVVSTVVAGLLVFSPVALASDFCGHHGGGHHHGGGRDGGCDQSNSLRDEGGHGGGLLNISNIGVQVPVQACNNSIVDGVLGVLSRDQRNDDRH